MQEPLIQKILALTKCTFARRPSSKLGRRKRIIGADKLPAQMSEISALMNQVRYNICNMNCFYIINYYNLIKMFTTDNEN